MLTLQNVNVGEESVRALYGLRREVEDREVVCLTDANGVRCHKPWNHHRALRPPWEDIIIREQWEDPSRTTQVRQNYLSLGGRE